MTNRNATSPWPFVGMGGMACALFLYVFAGLVAPWYVVAALLAVWLVLFVVATRWWTPHPTRVPLVAVGAVAIWFVAIMIGGARFGWTG